METKTLYRVLRPDGGIDITPNKPTSGEYEETYRLIASEGCILTDGENEYICIDTKAPNKFIEVSKTAETDYAEAGKILLGVSG